MDDAFYRTSKADRTRQIAEKVAELPLFAAQRAQAKRPEADIARDVERLIPLAKELARKAAHHGVTVADLRIAAVNRGLLTGEEEAKRLSYLGTVMSAAGLEPTPRHRRSHIGKSHGNLHVVWVWPDISVRDLTQEPPTIPGPPGTHSTNDRGVG